MGEMLPHQPTDRSVGSREDPIRGSPSIQFQILSGISRGLFLQNRPGGRLGPWPRSIGKPRPGAAWGVVNYARKVVKYNWNS